jgi:predicted choloylglycine hydrolase
MSTDGRLAYIEIEGAPHDIGVGLGRFGKAAAHRLLVGSDAWKSVMAFRGHPLVAAMRRQVEERFPSCWSEIQGLAIGIDLPLDDVFLWNCRGDVWAMAPDGCTTVQLPGKVPVIAHNEDGAPAFRGHCALAHIRPAGATAFTSFVYPASIAGHTFAATGSGLVQTVNNIRSRAAGPGLPRMVLGRALLDCASLEAAVRLLETSPRAGGFHMTLAQCGDPRVISIEFSHSNCSVVTLERPRCHSNHLIHQGMADQSQFVTASSLSRQRRGDQIINSAISGDLDPLTVLWDRGMPALPVYRSDPDDPDDENTLATAVFNVGASALEWRVYDRAGDAPRFTMKGALSPSPLHADCRSERTELHT